jgi:hypothetical protein
VANKAVSLEAPEYAMFRGTHPILDNPAEGLSKSTTRYFSMQINLAVHNEGVGQLIINKQVSQLRLIAKLAMRAWLTVKEYSWTFAFRCCSLF